MCGIAGALAFSNSSFEVTEKYITAMRDTMIHRGPDGAGTWVSKDRKVGLGHRRLSIIDLSEAAGQPMCNHDGSIFLVYNGEIYNHEEIRTELDGIRPRKWKTDHSDTEVIIHAYEEWGFDCLEKFRGMFAFALWDERLGRLWLVRDRIGIKPLYYSIHHGRITFASEIKALLKDPDQKRVLNERSFFHFLSMIFPPAPDTLFEGIEKLPGGCWLTIDRNGKVEKKRYWDVLDRTTSLQGVHEDEIAGMILDTLRDAVRLRKVSDVPVGVFLSGGVDSSTNTALFSEGASEPVKTFTIGYDTDYETYKNEIHYAKKMAEYGGAIYHEKLLNIDDLIDFMPRMVHLQDEPIADPVCIPVYYVSKLARDNGVIVCQVGEGADELFFGYGHWASQWKLQQWDRLPVPRFLKKLGLHALGAAGKEHTIYYEWLRRGAMGQPVFWGSTDYFSDAYKKQLMSQRMCDQFSDVTTWEALSPLRERFMEKDREKSDMNWMTFLDLQQRLPELLLMRVDKMSMGVSLETRVPFLDHKFVELAMSIPSKLKYQNGVLKYMLKKAVRGIIPDELIDRPKQGFGVPVTEWFFDRLGDSAKKEIYHLCDETDLFNKKQINEMLETYRIAELWNVYNFAMWWKEFME